MLLIYCIKRINYKPSYDAVLLILPACWKEKELLHGTGVDWKHKRLKHYKYFKWAALSLSFHRCNMIHFMEIKAHQFWLLNSWRIFHILTAATTEACGRKGMSLGMLLTVISRKNTVCLHEQENLDGFPGIILQTALRLGLFNTWSTYKDNEMFFLRIETEYTNEQKANVIQC